MVTEGVAEAQLTHLLASRRGFSHFEGVRHHESLKTNAPRRYSLARWIFS